MKKIIIATLISAVILFLWSGATQMLPWGVPTAQNVNVQSAENTKQTDTPSVIKLDANSLTTDKFETQFLNKVSIYSTDDTYSWIVTNPIRNDYSKYFLGEFLTQLMVGLFLSIILILTVNMKLKSRLVLVGIMGLCAVAGTYGQLMNWWELPASYGIGVGVNLVIGWLFASVIVCKFIIKSKPIAG